MARTAADIGTPRSQRWPPPGWHLCTCVKAVRWLSPHKRTPAVMLTWRTPDDHFEFEDPVFVTGKALQRLNLVALYVCQMPGETTLADDDREAAKYLSEYIVRNAQGRQARVEIVTEKQEFIHEEGPNVGQKGVTMRHRVSFSGYQPPDAHVPPSEPPPAPRTAPVPQQPPEDAVFEAEEIDGSAIPF